MCENTLCEGCRTEKSNTIHTLEFKSLIWRNEIVTYLPSYKDLYGEDEDKKVYLARVIKDNSSRLPIN